MFFDHERKYREKTKNFDIGAVGQYSWRGTSFLPHFPEKTTSKAKGERANGASATCE